jgi:AcrR family transcriptional regulator
LTGEEPKRQRNQRGEGAKLRDEVIEAAMRILDRAPASTLSLRMVAREAGVAAPSLYRQFDDAAALMTTVAIECWAQIGAEMAASASACDMLPASALLQELMGTYVQYAMRRPSRYQLLFALSEGWETVLEGPIRPVYRAVLAAVTKHVETGGRLPARDPVSATLLTISLAHGRIALARLAPARRGNLPTEVEAFIRETIGGLFA